MKLPACLPALSGVVSTEKRRELENKRERERCGSRWLVDGDVGGSYSNIC
jgi:hypothetical protein